MSKSFETPRYPSAEQQVVDALLWSFFGPAFLKQFLSLEHSTGEHFEHGSKFQRFNLWGDIASHISTWLTEYISSCIKHHFTYKVCIQLSAFFIFFHHHLSHKVAIIPLPSRLDLRKLIDIRNTSLHVMYLRFKVARLDQPIHSQPHPSICYWWPSWAPQKYEVLSRSAAYRVATRPNNLQGASVACDAAMQGVVLW